MAQTNLKNITPHSVSYRIGTAGDFLCLKQNPINDSRPLNLRGIQP